MAITRGTWEAWKSPSGKWAVKAVYEDDQGNRHTTWPAVCDATGEDNEANARLIAAAKQLILLERTLRTRLPDIVDPLIVLVENSEDPPNPPKRTAKANLLYLLNIVRNDIIFPMDKLQRWVGFVQGVLAARGILDVDAERDRTREIFHEIYKAAGITPPPKQEVPNNV